MKRIVICLLVLAMILPCLPAAAEGGDTVTYRDMTVSRDTEYVDFGQRAIYKWDLVYDFLQQLPNLKKVDMFGATINLKVYNKLNELFPDVEFNCLIQYGQHRACTTDTAFSTLFSGGQQLHKYEEIAMLKWCKNLYALDVGHHPIRKLDFLYDMPELRVLIVAINELTDITPIASLKHLEYLEIFHNQITDLSPLKDLEYLMDLDLVKNKVTDLTPVMGLKRLKRLWIYWSNYPDSPSAETVAQLQEALPDCHID